jgi:hypothetical protein
MLHCKRVQRAAAVALASLVLLDAGALHAEPGTLMKWGYGDGGEGGPNRDEPLVTDRPDFTEASSTVGQGVAQLEGGYTYSYDSDDTGSFKSHSFPETLLRVGVQEGILPEMALITQMTVPTGSSEFTADETLPGLVWLYGWDLNDWIASGAQTKANRALDDVTGEPYLEFSQSWTINYRLHDRVGAYTEWFALIPDGADTNHNENYADGGFTFLVNNDLQLDIRSGVGLNEAADDYFIGTGFAIRR